MKNTGKTPSSHVLRFNITKEKFYEIYNLIDKDFPFYQDSYGKIMSKELAEVIRDDAKIAAKKLELKYNKDVLDIVQFGSSIFKEDSNDVDIAVIFNKIHIKEQLEQAQEIKKQIQKNIAKTVHINAFDILRYLKQKDLY